MISTISGMGDVNNNNSSSTAAIITTSSSPASNELPAQYMGAAAGDSIEARRRRHSMHRRGDWRKRLTIRNRNLALGILCCCALMQNVIVGGANNAILSTIEKAYYMTSVESAMFLSMYDIANIIASPIIGFFGDRKQKTRIIGLSMIGLGIGSSIMILPQFITPRSTDHTQRSTNMSMDIDFSSSSELICYPPEDRSIKTTTPSSVPVFNPLFNNMKYLFYLANVFNGVSSVALYTIVISFIEGMFIKEKVHMRQGLYYAIGAIGVGIGMLTTGNFLNINGNLIGGGSSNKPGSSSSGGSNSVNWIGAWWLIYIPGALIDFTLAFLVFLFSPNLTRYQPGCQEQLTVYVTSHTGTIAGTNEPATTTTMTATTTTIPRSNQGYSIKEHAIDFVRSARTILANRIFVFIVLCTTTETFLIKGFSSYLSKYLEYQYRLAASTATMIVGALGFVSLMLGVFLGSFLVKHFKWQIRQCVLFIVFILSLTCILFFGLLISGPQETYIGSQNAVYQQSNCSCDPNTYYPVCYRHLYLFQTPCYAGCTGSISQKQFTNCSVLGALLYPNMTNSGGNGASNSNETQYEYFEDAGNMIDLFPPLSACARPNPRGYRNLVFVAVFGFTILFLSSIIILPVLRIILESVSAENQSFALGIRSLVNKTLGNIPGPIVFAAIVDKSCIQWIVNQNHTGKTCVLYNNRRFSIGLAVLGFGLRFCSAIFAFLTFIHIRQLEFRTSMRAKSTDAKLEAETKCSLETNMTSTNMQLQQPEEFTYINRAYANDVMDANDVILENADDANNKVARNKDDDQDYDKLSSQI